MNRSHTGALNSLRGTQASRPLLNPFEVAVERASGMRDPFRRRCPEQVLDRRLLARSAESYCTAPDRVRSRNVRICRCRPIQETTRPTYTTSATPV